VVLHFTEIIYGRPNNITSILQNSEHGVSNLLLPSMWLCDANGFVRLDVICHLSVQW